MKILLTSLLIPMSAFAGRPDVVTKGRPLIINKGWPVVIVGNEQMVVLDVKNDEVLVQNSMGQIGVINVADISSVPLK